MTSPRAIGIFVCTALALAATRVAAQLPGPNTAPARTMQALRLEEGERITLDGLLDESAWTRAMPARDFIQIDPRNGAPASEPTEVRIAFDDHSLYMAVTCYDSEPTKWLGYQRRRDEFLQADDRFMWAIDTFLDGRSGYFFEMNPSGLMGDSTFGVNGDNRAWDGIWNAKVRHNATGWVIEIEIPFRTLNFDPNSDTWGINFQRTVRRKNEDSIWNGWARNQGVRRMTNAGRVFGLSHLAVSRGLEVKPYGLVTAGSRPGIEGAGASTDVGHTAGLDVLYNPAPGVRASVTVNTDFAQTEVDQRQVNLTQFALFFPERRDFFLDGATYFDFGSSSGSGETLQPFFTRRIGLGSDAATPQRVNVGAKFMGQVGRQDVGIMHVSTGADEGLGFIGEDFTIARVKRRVLSQSYIGGMYTRRAARNAGGDVVGDTGATSQTAGVDFRLATSQFRGSQNLNAIGWYIHASRPGVVNLNDAYGLTIEYPNDRWFGNFTMREVQRNFDPAVGFVGRRNYRRYSPFVGFGPRPKNSRLVRQYIVNGNVELLTDLSNSTLRRTVGVTPLQVQLQSQDSFSVDVNRVHERLDQPFPISSGITLPIGAEYDYSRVGFSAQTANKRKLALNARFETGSFYSGDRRQTILGLTVRARPGYIVSLNGEWNQVALAEGRFSSNVFRVVGDAQFTPFMALVNNVQFDTVSQAIGWQSRFRWIMKPGNDLYVVYTHNWVETPLDHRFATFDQKLASKVLYTHRF